MTIATPSPERCAATLPCTFVVCSAAADAGLAHPPARRPEGLNTARRRRDAALAAAIAARWPITGALAVATLVLGAAAWLWGGDEAKAWFIAAAAGTTACGAAARSLVRSPHHTVQALRMRRWGVLSAAATLLLFLLAPWVFRSNAGQSGVVLAAIAGSMLAVVGAIGLAPLRAAALAAALLPLATAFEAAGNAGAFDSALMASGLFASAGIACLAIWQNLRWQAAARSSIKQADRITELEMARDAAIRADYDKSRFLAIASHDLRQPVHAIGLFAATLEKRLEGSAEEPLVRNLSRAIDGLDRSFNVMLDISRLDAGAIEPRVQHFPLRDLFRRLHMHYAGQAEQKGLGLRFSPGGKSLSSDPHLLERILGNLIQNAIKYTERGGIVVVARNAPGCLHIEIWDTGIGIRSADLPRVFEEFYQVGRHGRTRAQGLGMGLAIVKRLARLLGHELTVSSRPGRGTMFRLRIKLGVLPEIQDVTAPADTRPMPPLQSRTVLVIDDEEPIREGLCLLLNEWGYDAIVAGSIEEAEHTLASLDALPDLILSDLHLGEGPDGIAAIERIRRRCGCDIAAMLITGDTSLEQIRRATESGLPVLFKPVQPRKLYDALLGLAS